MVGCVSVQAVTDFRPLSEQPDAAGNGLAGFSAKSSMSDSTNCQRENANWTLADEASSTTASSTSEGAALLYSSCS